MAQGFLLGPDLLARTRRTIETVEGGVVGSGFRAIPTVLEGETPTNQKTFRICEFTGAWSIGAVKNVKLKYVEGATNTVNVTNLFFPIPSPTGPTDCAIAKDGTAWFLVSPTFEAATAVFVQATASAAIVTSFVQQTVVSDVQFSAVLNTSNCQITLARTQSTGSVTSISGTATAAVISSAVTAALLRFKV